MISFNALNVKRGEGSFMVDGILVSADGHSRAYVEGMLVDIVSIDHSDGDNKPKVWIQSVCPRSHVRASDRRKVKRGKDVWYTLGEPADEYVRYHEPFLWLAAFARYFVAY